jgi:hypothetical protein
MMFIVLMILATNPFAAHETADKLELNHFHDECGKPVYTQVIIYDFNNATTNEETRHWYLVNPGKDWGRYPTYCSGSDRWAVRWLDKEQMIGRQITAPSYVETFTQTDQSERTRRFWTNETECS